MLPHSRDGMVYARRFRTRHGDTGRQHTADAVFVLFSYFMDGFAFAGEAICGNCLGASDRNRLDTAIRALLRWGLWVAVIFTAIYFICGKWIMQLLSGDANVVAASREYFHWVILIPITGFLAFTWDGVYIGITRTHEMLLSMALSTVLYFTLYFLLYPHIGNHGIWIAFICYLLSRGVVLHICINRVKRKIFCINRDKEVTLQRQRGAAFQQVG